MEEIYYFQVAIRRYRRIVEGLKHGELALSFFDHMASQGVSGQVCRPSDNAPEGYGF